MGLDRPKLPILHGRTKRRKMKVLESRLESKETPAAKVKRLGKAWALKFPTMAGNPGLGSWLDSKVDLDDQGEKVISIGCKCCHFAKVLAGAFANYQVKTVTAMQSENFRKHERSRFHKKAVACFVAGTKDVSISAPSEQTFDAVCDRIIKGEATCGTLKEKAVTWCISEAILCVNQHRVSKAKSVALFRDGRNARLAIRFRAVTPSLDVYSGFLGQERDYGGSALQIVNATGKVMKRFSTRFGAAPGNNVKKEAFLKTKLFKGLRHAVAGGFS